MAVKKIILSFSAQMTGFSFTSISLFYFVKRHEGTGIHAIFSFCGMHKRISPNNAKLKLSATTNAYDRKQVRWTGDPGREHFELEN